MIPDYLSEIWAAVGPAVVNHLWQSTLFLLIAGLLTLTLRKNQARARYWLWLAASLKFLIPFSLLVVIGTHLARPSNAAFMQPGFYSAVEEVATVSDFLTVGFSPKPTVNLKAVDRGYPLIHWLPVFLIAIWLGGFVAVLFVWFVRWRRMSRSCRAAGPIREGCEVEVLRRVERRARIRKRIEIRLSRSSLEPGIFGILHPVLVWPEGISERLDDSQLEAILAHEMWHVRRRDNLAALLHMAVEALFWFHPLVWWMGARLVEERERACDEAVVQLGEEPGIYAESILRACEFCIESPLACVSGVTGSDLKKRIIRIMTQRVARKLDVRRKLLLGVAGFLAIAVPIGFGLAHGKPGQTNAPQSAASSQAEKASITAPKFEVASIKPDKSGALGSRLMIPPGRFTATNVTTKMLIEFAYNLKSDHQISGAPSWIDSEKFDIEAKEDDPFVAKMRKPHSFEEQADQVRLMVQSLLADRYRLKVSHEMKELPVYALVVAKNGPKLTPSKLPPPGLVGTNKPAGPKGFRGMQMGRGGFTATGAPISLLAKALSRMPEIGRVVIDQTGLKGTYDFTLQWTPEFARSQMAGGSGPDGGPEAGGNGQATTGIPPATADSSDSSGPSIFTAIQQQLGLRLKPEKGPVEVLVIDHIEPPTPN